MTTTTKCSQKNKRLSVLNSHYRYRLMVKLEIDEHQNYWRSIRNLHGS